MLYNTEPRKRNNTRMYNTDRRINRNLQVRESRAHNNTERKLDVENASQRVSSQLKSSRTEVGKDRSEHGPNWARTEVGA